MPRGWSEETSCGTQRMHGATLSRRWSSERHAKCVCGSGHFDGDVRDPVRCPLVYFLNWLLCDSHFQAMLRIVEFMKSFDWLASSPRSTPFVEVFPNLATSGLAFQ
mmetsp:Transcript_52609/g.140211  ORF Transcript_52609/g.140211 Transcript_52609/m.140211 type:complete len:106 (-) Transcript_52609:53-370(-)